MGGAAGHMNHPFDIEWVNTGEDLIDFFIDAAEHLQEKPASIKWDGINVSFKLVTDSEGRKDFRIDRGNQEPASVIGMTAAAAYKKWKPGHGMPIAIEKLLTIFNEALPEIEQELKALGMWEDSTKLFNTEYIGAGGSNVIQYGKNILAIHGINQFYEKKAQPHRIRKGTGMDRPGLERPVDPETGKLVKGTSIEIDYDRGALESLIEKVGPIATKYDFSILGDTPTENVSPIEYEEVLDTNFPITLTEDNVENHSIREWLRDAVNPRDARITIKEGKDIGALSKQVYIAVLNGVPLVGWLESQEDVKKAVSGAVFYHATKELGNAVKRSLRVSEGVSNALGWDQNYNDVANHEGVILRDSKFGSKPVKITGEFILEGLASTHGDASKQELAQQTEVPVAAEVPAEKSKLALIAGGFKPPHKGHLEMVKYYNNLVGQNGRVIILLGGGGKVPRTINGRPITAQDSVNIWEIFLKNEPSITWPSDRIEFQNVEGAGPIAPIIDYVREQAPADQIILLGAGEKDEDRWPKIMADPRNNPRGIEIQTAPAPNMVDENGAPLSARNMRDSIERGDYDTFKSYIPDSSMDDAEGIFAMLGNANVEEPQEEPQEQLQEVNPLPLGIFLRLVERILYEERADIQQLRADVEQRPGHGIENVMAYAREPEQNDWYDPDIANNDNDDWQGVERYHEDKEGLEEINEQNEETPISDLINQYGDAIRPWISPVTRATSRQKRTQQRTRTQITPDIKREQAAAATHRDQQRREVAKAPSIRAMYSRVIPYGNYLEKNKQGRYKRALEPVERMPEWSRDMIAQARERGLPEDSPPPEAAASSIAAADLKETSSMAGGNVAGFSGKQNEEESLIREEEDELVEEVMNYLFNKIGV